MKRDECQLGLKKIYKEIKKNRREIERDRGKQVRNRQR